jgi:hypothetical protein
MFSVRYSTDSRDEKSLTANELLTQLSVRSSL